MLLDFGKVSVDGDGEFILPIHFSRVGVCADVESNCIGAAGNNDRNDGEGVIDGDVNRRRWE